MHNHFILLGPGERKKGGVGTGTQNNSADSPGSPHTTPHTPVTYLHKEGLLLQIKGKYHRDPFYKKILDSPQEFKSFEATKDSSIHLKLADQRVLCIPNI